MRALSLVMCAALALGMSACSAQGSSDSDWGVGEVREPATSLSAITESEGDAVRVFVPVGVERNRVVLAAQKSLVIGAGAKIVDNDAANPSSVSALGGVTVGKSATLGSLYSGSPDAVELAEGVALSGFAKVSGTIRAATDVKFAAGKIEGAEGAGEAYSWAVRFSDKPVDLQVSRDAEILQVKPAGYAGLVVESGSTAVLSNGEYAFQSLEVKEGGTLEIDNTAGAVYVWVRNSLIINGAMLHDSVLPRVMFGYLGTEAPQITAEFRGTLVAPNAKVTLGKTASPHVGSFFASSIEVAPGAIVQHQPFVPNAMDNVDSAISGTGFISGVWLTP